MKTTTGFSRELKKAVRIVLPGLLFSMAPALQANAALVLTDLNPADANSITGQLDEGYLLTVYEDYNESYLTPYPSHDGYAVVNASGGYFDKILTYNSLTPGIVHLQFEVTNTTQYDWSDYHIEFWDSSFLTRLTDIQVTAYSTDQFVNKSFSEGIVSYWSPGEHYGSPIEDIGGYHIAVNLYDLSGGTGVIGIRQVATTTPEPGTFVLLSFGLAGLLGYRRSKAVA